jgi:phasin
MSETKTSIAKARSGDPRSPPVRNANSANASERSFKSDLPKADATVAAREFAQQGAALVKDVSEKTQVTAEETSKLLSETYSTVTKSATDFNREWIEMVHANANSTLDFVQRLLGVKSPTEFLEVSAKHARKQFETFAEQTQKLTGLTQKVTTDALEPIQAGMRKALTKAS